MNRFVGGLIVGAVALVALGCGSSGDSGTSRIRLLEAELETVRLEAQEAEREAEAQREAREAALAAEAAAQAAARQEAAERLEAEQQRDAAQEQIDDAQAAAAAAQASAAEAQAQAAEIIRVREASQRAQFFQAAFPTATIADPPDMDTAGVMMNSPVRGRLDVTRGGWRASTLGGSGIRSTTLPLASSANTGKTVVYRTAN